ncbi:MAG: type II toxin-antitoxin system death-on-curing family toxin [Pseudomonadota bacterium]|nr:type II toxin-antitoxin system death-on-curing family toxin [Pseudomonadota bacterium]
MSHWVWVRLAVVLAVHDRALAAYGGSEGIRDLGVLEGALGRPQNLAAYEEPDIADLAALYAAGIAKAHAFVDGNKRTAWTIARTFLELNGHGLACEKAEAVLVMERVANDLVDATALAEWFRCRLRRR